MVIVWDEVEVSVGRFEGCFKVWVIRLDVFGGWERRWLEG